MLTASGGGGGGMMIGREGRRSSRAVMGGVVVGLCPADLKVLEQSDSDRPLPVAVGRISRSLLVDQRSEVDVGDGDG